MISTKVTFYVIKLVYPKYNPVWFMIYMYLIYFRTIKRKIVYSLKPVPCNIIMTFGGQQYFNDINNTVIVHKDNLYSHDKVLLLYAEGSNFYRPVYVLGSKNCSKEDVMLSTLYHNIPQKLITVNLTKYQLLEYKENFIQFADELEISLIQSPFDISNAVIDEVLEKYFALPKIVKKGDIIEINIKCYAPDLFYRNSKINHIDNVYIQCNKIKVKDNDKDETYLCVIGHTELKQSPNVQSYLPKKFCKQLNFGHNNVELPLCPYGLQNYLDKLHKSVKPFLFKSNYCLFNC